MTSSQTPSATTMVSQARRSRPSNTVGMTCALSGKSSYPPRRSRTPAFRSRRTRPRWPENRNGRRHPPAVRSRVRKRESVDDCMRDTPHDLGSQAGQLLGTAPIHSIRCVRAPRCRDVAGDGARGLVRPSAYGLTTRTVAADGLPATASEYVVFVFELNFGPNIFSTPGKPYGLRGGGAVRRKRTAAGLGAATPGRPREPPAWFQGMDTVGFEG